MPRRYRLRLGDGTILMVDQQGLNTWKVDAKAMVQAAGGNWRPLKDLLAMQAAAAKYAAQNEPSAPVPSPATALPLVPPPPRGEKLRPPTPRPAPEAVAAPPVLEEPPPVVLPEEPARPLVDISSPEPTTDESPPISPADFRPDEELAPFPDAFARDEAPALAAAEPPEPQAWADEPAIFTTASEAVAASPPPEEPVAREDEVASLPAPGPPGRDNVWDPEPSQWSDAVTPPAIGAPRAVQSLADDPVPRQRYEDESSTYGGSPSYSSRASFERDDPDSYAASEPGFHEDEPDDFDKPRPIVLDERFVRVASVVGVVLSRSLDVLDRVLKDLAQALRKARASRAARRAAAPPREIPREEARTAFVEQEPPSVLVVADEPADSRYGDAPARPTPPADLPIIPLKPLDAEGSTRVAVRDFVRRVSTGVSAWAVSLPARVQRLFRRDRPTLGSSGPWSEPSSSPPTLGVAYEPPREPLKPPPSTSEIPVLRLAKIEEVEEPEDLYEGPSEGAYFPAVWLWTKRLAWTALFAVGGLLVYRNWEAWSPKAQRLSSTAFTEVTKYAETREQKARTQQALRAATQQIPHLSPDTIGLVLSRSASGVPDPPEVFQVASDAADRGLKALTPAERQELSALRNALLAALSPAERVLLREYDDVRARRMPFAFEDRSALDLFARGARGLPPESRERLQVLLGQAVAAGLASPVRDPAAAPPGK